MTKTIETMEALAEKAFDQAKLLIYKNRSALYKEKEHELYVAFREIQYLWEQVISIGEAEFDRLLAVFNLSVCLSDELNKLDGCY